MIEVVFFSGLSKNRRRYCSFRICTPTNQLFSSSSFPCLSLVDMVWAQMCILTFVCIIQFNGVCTLHAWIEALVNGEWLTCMGSFWCGLLSIDEQLARTHTLIIWSYPSWSSSCSPQSDIIYYIYTHAVLPQSPFVVSSFFNGAPHQRTARMHRHVRTQLQIQNINKYRFCALYI